MKRSLFILLGVVVLVMVAGMLTDAEAQCAMCRATVESNAVSKESTVGAGLNKGILYLMAIPYIVGGTIGLLWYRYSRKNKRAAQA